MATYGKSEGSKTSVLSTLPKGMSFDYLEAITDDFSDERIISEGAFGTLFKGVLSDGEVIAVKKLGANAPVPRERVFITELQNFMALQHENLVQLINYCHEQRKIVVKRDGRYIVAETVESLLCYEYVPRGSLDKYIFAGSNSIDWDTRFKIIKGTCQGLHFLHQIPVVHMDLKPEHILLDNDFVPKITEFSHSRIFGEEQTRLKTQNIVGSYGYMAPEYLYRGEISAQVDIYSLGLVIIETTTREKNNSGEENEPTAVKFFERVRENWTEKEYIASQYPSLGEDGLQQVTTCIEIALECVEIVRKKRPSIGEIIDRLNECAQIRSGSDSLANGKNSSLLSLEEPQQLHFPFEPKRLTSRSLHLTNRTDDRVVFMLVTKIPKRYLTKLPLCGIVPPKCIYTITVTMREQKKLTPSKSDEFLTLQSSIVRDEVMENVDPVSMAMLLDTASDEVQEVKVMVICQSQEGSTSNQSIESATEIIASQNYRQVLSVDMHPREPWILTSNQKGYACLWNYRTWREVKSFEVSREGEPVYSAKFIEREEWLVIGRSDGSIYVYDYDTTDEVESFVAHGGPVTSLAVHPTHPFALSASDDDDLIKLWDWSQGWACAQTFEGHNKRITQVMFDPNDSNCFASASLDGTVKIWNSSAGTCIITLDGHPDGLFCLRYFTGFNRNLLISGSSDGAAMIWDLQTDSCIDTLEGHVNHLSALCWHPELPVLITGSLDGTVRIWKSTTTTYRLQNIISFNLGAVNALGYIEGLKRIVAGCDQGVAMMEINLS